LSVTQRPRGVARTEAEAKRHAEEDAAIAKAKEEAKATAAARANQNGLIHDSPKIKLQSINTCLPTLPDSAVVTPSTKGPRLEGQRNLQDTTFSISGESKIRFQCIFYVFSGGGFILIREFINCQCLMFQLRAIRLLDITCSLLFMYDYKLVLFAEDVEEARRACIRVNNPPGGRSAGGFW